MSMPVEPTERFSNRVESYKRHRPGYPTAIVDLLTHECGLDDNSVIADVAAGTGLLSEIFLSRGYRVIAVEPNQQMRDACATLTSQYPQLQCVDGTAETTSLADNSIDLATVGQAMHWFDLKRTRNEFVRVLRSGGWCAVIYNNRCMAGDAFQEGYEKILAEYGTDYGAVRGSHLTEERLAAFFVPDAMSSAVFANSQQLTLEALQGRILSSSYMPQPGHPRYSEMSRTIEDLFSENETGGHVRMEYDCVVCYGYLS